MAQHRSYFDERDVKAASERQKRRLLLQTYALRLIHNQNDRGARAGLRGLGVPISLDSYAADDRDDAPNPAEPDMLNDERSDEGAEANAAPREPVQPTRADASPSPSVRPVALARPAAATGANGGSAKAADDSGAIRKRGTDGADPRRERWLFALLIPAILLGLFSLILPWVALRHVNVNFNQTQTFILEPARLREQMPPDLLESGRTEETPEGVLWQIEPMYPLTPEYQAAVAEGVLDADADITRADVGTVSALRTAEGVRYNGVDSVRLSAERRLVLGSAIWRFVEDRGRFPADLSELVPDYIDRIPMEPVSGQRTVNAAYTGAGGWVWEVPELSSGDLWTAIDRGLRANLPAQETGETADSGELPFAPITVRVSKADQRVQVWSGNTLLREYEAGGINDYTPVGTFRIDQRAVLAGQLADGSPNPFGTRWLRLAVQGDEGNFGFHGSDTPENFNPPLSLGCIRLAEGDLEDFYELIPTGTPVIIQAEPFSV